MISAYEQMLVDAGFGPVAGADEAGRGACAGPLVAAAVVLSPDPQLAIPGLNDSKALSPARRDRMFPQILRYALAVDWVVVQAGECDRLGVQAANLGALKQAVAQLSGAGVRPGFAIIDGFPVEGLECPSLGMWKGDQVVQCVAAASIVAKVTRDRIMNDLDVVFPGYGFAQHKGYVTAYHQRQLELLGPCPQHRMSYGNVVRTTRVGGS
ncbi:MAG: ribonuclease HII [Propionibacteriaceae bacterium]|jgi:ribonuclease HII|nr:ribonuclease HII [Propionibacteriaceae bacterium]